MAKTSKKEIKKNFKKSPKMKKNDLIESKLDESSGKTKVKIVSKPSPSRAKKPFPIWSIVSLLLAIALGAFILYEFNSDFRQNVNKLINRNEDITSTEGLVNSETPKDNFVIKLNIVYDKEHPIMKSSIEDYLKRLETNLENTTVSPNWIDRNDDLAKQLIQKVDAKSLPIFITDSSITKHPKYSLFKDVIEERNGEYQFKSQGMEYIKLPSTENANFLGADPKTAKLVIVEYTSLSCKYCQMMHSTLGKVIDTYGSKVSWVIKLYDRGASDSLLSQAVECAAEQKLFRKMIDIVYSKQVELFELFRSTTSDPEAALAAQLEKLAVSIGANKASFSKCLSSGVYKEKVANETKEGIDFGVSGTPSLFLGNTFINGAVEEGVFMKMVEEALNK